MSLTLHSILIPDFVRGLRALSGVLTKSEAHCTANGLDQSEITAAKLADDMFDFSYQVKSVKVHSLGAIEGTEAGSFSPDFSTPPTTFAEQQEMIAQTITALEAMPAARVDALEGRDTEFRFGERAFPYTAEDFLLSFSLPNFYFHLTTAYDIARWKGVNVGKRDFLGAVRMKKTQ
ncbi:MAG: DUF1993 domain-containing protein [Sphingomonadales bacterium]|nr:DUF1993 domain-containing protein [Sphingomonadales bacterium]MDE2569110.1 DUF1993 domain-containing protein [Sphingomonadales bacterium]